MAILPSIATITRVLVQATNVTGQSIPTGATTTVTGWVAQQDVSASFNATTGVFTAPRNGNYRFCIALAYTFTNATAGIVTAELTGAVSRSCNFPFGVLAFDNTAQLDSIVSLTAGQTINIATFQNSGIARSLNAGASRNWLSIVELPSNF